MFRPLRRHQRVTDVVAAVVFGLLMLAATVSWLGMSGATTFASSRQGVILAAVITAVFSVALAFRRLSPALGLALAWAGAVVQMLCQLPPLPANLAVLGVLYTAAAYGSIRLFWVGFASTLVGAATITVYLIIPALVMVPTPPGDLVTRLLAAAPLFLASALGLLLAWTTGALFRAALRARTNAEAQRRAEELAATEAERTRIARDMHDVVAHSLAVVIAQADGARYASAAEPGVASDALATISATARAALSDVRMLLTQLRHSEGKGPQPSIADLENVYAQVRAAGVDLRLDVDPIPSPPPPAAVQLAVFRIMQEALTNALRHGAGATVEVRLAWLRDSVDLRVTNPLPAPVPEPHPGGHGVIGMRERAQLIGGRCDAVVSGDAFVVTASVPLEYAQ